MTIAPPIDRRLIEQIVREIVLRRSAARRASRTWWSAFLRGTST